MCSVAHLFRWTEVDFGRSESGLIELGRSKWIEIKVGHNELGRIDRLARQRRNAVHYEKQVYIPKFNSGGPDNLMQQMEMNSWSRQMKAYSDSGQLTPSKAKEILNVSFLCFYHTTRLLTSFDIELLF